MKSPREKKTGTTRHNPSLVTTVFGTEHVTEGFGLPIVATVAGFF
jgi:hypothetical protein